MSRRRSGKTALVLAGGGLTGGVYEIGALRAIDDLLVDRTVNDFDIYVGTSAGALVASFLANGVSPEEMLQVINGEMPGILSFERHHLFHINPSDYLNWSLRLPKRLLSAWTEYLFNFNEMTLFDLVWSLTETLPAGMYDGLGLEKFIRHALVTLERSNEFSELQRELYIIATDLDNGERVVFGQGAYRNIPISMAIAASSALPILYKPVQIGQQEFIDGGLRGTASLDVAIERGATLVVCINPLVPLEKTDTPKLDAADKSSGEHLSNRGIQSITNQSLRIFSHSGLQYHIKQLRRTHPEVDIILIEPDHEDYQMFFYNIMRYSARLIVAQHGFESATLDLAMDYKHYKQVLARHGIPLSRRLVIQELSEIADSNYDPQVIRKVLKAKSAGCGQQRQNTPVCILNRALAELEMTLDQIASETQFPYS